MQRTAQAMRIHFDLQYVGKLVKMAKRRVTWKFAFEGDHDEHSLVLQHTLNSGKKIIFRNGEQIFEEEKLSAGDFVYPFQLEGHLITVVIVSQLDVEGMYDLRVDGKSFFDLRMTTLMDLRARLRSDRENASAWGRGGSGGGGAATDAGNSYEDEGPRAPEPKVATLSMKDFVGDAPAKTKANAGGGGSWDPFSGSGDFGDDGFGASTGGNGGGFDDFGSSAPASAPAPAPAPAPALKKPTTSTTPVTGGLRPPVSGGNHRAPAPAPVPAPAPAAAAYDPFSDPAPAPAPAAANLADDFASLSFGAPTVRASAPAQAAKKPSSSAADPFDMSYAPASGAGAAPARGNSSGGLDDIFGGSSMSMSSSAPAPAHAAHHAHSTSGGLVNLDNLTAVKTSQSGPTGPTLGQLSSRPGIAGEKKNVMAGSGMAGASANVALGGLDFGLGMPPRGPSGAPAQSGGMGMGMGGMQGGMGGYGMQQQQPMGGMGGMQGMGYGMPQQQPMGGMGGFGMTPAPAPAPKPAEEYNPFDM